MLFVPSYSLNQLVSVCPAPFWNHVLGYWEQRHNPNLLIIKYEDMKKVRCI